jgi:hypothetical protein
MILILAVALFGAWSAAPADAASDGRVKSHGVLTSIESDGTVVINDKGYEVDPAARILDGRGKRTSLDRFYLPARVQFEFTYLQRGPVIRLIREVPQ